MKRCYLVRHGQTEWNGTNRIQGRSDIPLNAMGLQQAKQLGAFFSGFTLHGIYTSSLTRSVQTAAAIASTHRAGLTPIVEPELVEMHLGAWEGLTPPEVDAQYAGAYEAWRRMPSAVRIPQAEPVDTFKTRVRRVLNKIVSSVDQGEYVIVAHGGVIASALADLLGADYDAILRRMRLDNAGVTAVEFDAPTPHVLWINHTGHLDSGRPVPGGWF